MRRATVRFGESLWDLIEDEANRDRVSAAQWVRDATIMRAMWEQQRRGIPDGVDILAIIRDEIRAESDARQKTIRDVLVHGRQELEAIIDRLPEDSANWLREVYGLDKP